MSNLASGLLILSSIFVVARNPNAGRSELEVEVEEVEEDDQGAAAQEHGDGSEDPKEHREGEVECP